MRRVFSFSVVLASALLAGAAIAGLSGCQTKLDNTAAALPAQTDLPGLQSVGLHQVWQRQLALEPGEQMKKVWRVGKSVYVATSECRIIRIEAKTGAYKWSNGLGPENFEIYKPVELKRDDGFPSGQVLVVTRGEAFVFDMNTGDNVRMGHLGISVSADPVVIGNTLCVGGADTFYGLYMDPLAFGERWRIPVPGDLFISAPLAMDANVLVGSKNGLLWRISADSGDWDWKDRKTNGDIIGGLSADFNAVYVPCEDQKVYAFRSDTGGELWDQQLEGRLEEAPVLAGKVILVSSVNRTMFALGRQKGEIRWRQNHVSQVATVNDDTVWIGDTGGVIRLLSLETGEEKASALTTGIQFFVRNNMDQNVMLATHGGLIGLYSPATANEKP